MAPLPEINEQELLSFLTGLLNVPSPSGYTESAILYKVDIYPYYGSVGSALLCTGADLRVALIGPGVDASYHYERTHLDALLATTRWLLAD